MNGGHWTRQDFIHHLYGIGPGDGHLDVCIECREQWEILLGQRRTVLGAEPEVPNEFLSRQRREIHRRLENPPGQVRRIAPALAAVALMVVGFLVVQGPDPVPAEKGASVSDAQLFSEIYALEQSSEPHFATPMRGLFEGN